MITTKNKVSFSRQVWDELYGIDYFREVLEVIEDREALRQAKEKAEGFITFRQYSSQRKNKKECMR